MQSAEATNHRRAANRNLLITRIVLNTLKEMNPQYPHVSFDPLEVEIK